MAIQDMNSLYWANFEDFSVAKKCFNFTYCDFHVAKLAYSTEAASFLPQVAYSLTAHCCLTVPKGAAVSLHNQ